MRICTGGKEDGTEAFFGLHRSKVLKKYKKLKIGSIKGEKPQYVLPQIGELSKVKLLTIQLRKLAADKELLRYPMRSLPGSHRATKLHTSTTRIIDFRRRFAGSSTSMSQVRSRHLVNAVLP